MYDDDDFHDDNDDGVFDDDDEKGLHWHCQESEGKVNDEAKIYKYAFHQLHHNLTTFRMKKVT